MKQVYPLLVMIILAACAPMLAQTSETPVTINPKITATAVSTATPTATPTMEATIVPPTAMPKDIKIPDYLLDIPILSEAPRTLDEIPRVQSVDTDSGAFYEALRQEYIDGRIKHFDVDVPVLKLKWIDPLTDLNLKNNGVAPMVDRATFGKPHSDQFAGLYVLVDAKGKEQSMMAQIVKIGEGSEEVGVIFYRVPMSGNKSADLANAKEWLGNFKNAGLMQVIARWKDVAACEKYAGDIGGESATQACVNYLEDVQPTVEILVKQWIETGIFPSELGRIVVFGSLGVQFR